MKKGCLILTLLLLTLFLNAQDLIPRRLNISFSSDQQWRGIDGIIDDILLAELSLRNHIVPTINQEEAHSQILIERRAGGLYFSLWENGVLLEENALEEDSDDPQVLRSFCANLALSWSPHLTEVPQEIRSIRSDEEQDRADQVAFDSAMAMKFQYSLHITPFYQYWIGGGNESMDAHPMIEGTPLVIDGNWFYRDNFGLTASVYYHYSWGLKPLQFHTSTGDVSLDAHSHQLMTGIGFSYRSLGRFSSQFDLLYNVGLFSAESMETLEDPPEGIFIYPGDVEEGIIHIIAFRTAVMWNTRPDRAWSMRYTFHFNPEIMAMSDNTPGYVEATAISMNIGIGYVYRRERN